MPVIPAWKHCSLSGPKYAFSKRRNITAELCSVTIHAQNSFRGQFVSIIHVVRFRAVQGLCVCVHNAWMSIAVAMRRNWWRRLAGRKLVVKWHGWVYLCYGCRDPFGVVLEAYGRYREGCNTTPGSGWDSWKDGAPSYVARRWIFHWSWLRWRCGLSDENIGHSTNFVRHYVHDEAFSIGLHVYWSKIKIQQFGCCLLPFSPAGHGGR